MFRQLITPVADSLPASFLIATIPIATVLVFLGIMRRPAWQASAAGLVVALLLATTIWELPLGIALNSIAAGATFAAWPVMWIVVNALFLYNITVASGHFAAFRNWMIAHLPDDRRVVLVVVGFSFGCLLEGIAGFGAPIAITSALLIMLGFGALEAVTFTLIFNTAPVAFGALGSPVITLSAVTQLSDVALGAMIGRQLPFIAFILPFYVMIAYCGVRGLKAVWPVLAVSGGSFALMQFISSNMLGYALTDVLSSLTSLALTLAFVKIWRPAPDPEFILTYRQKTTENSGEASRSPWQGWVPWSILSVVVILWVHFEVNLFGQVQLSWPGLHDQVFITTYDRPYAAVWTFQPLATGTAIMAATSLFMLLCRLSPRQICVALLSTVVQVRFSFLTTVLIVGLAYLMNYSGITYTLGIGVASVGLFFPLISPFLGWLAVFLSGSDTSGNALFGNLQVVAARKLDLDPVLMAATNASGGVMGKMISPQNISTGTSTTELRGQEGNVLSKTFWHSVFLTFLLGLIVVVQQFLTPWIIPH
ncbi:L-lactate permease [Sphingobium sp. LMA1-1-1.1]